MQFRSTIAKRCEWCDTNYWQHPHGQYIHDCAAVPAKPQPQFSWKNAEVVLNIPVKDKDVSQLMDQLSAKAEEELRDSFYEWVNKPSELETVFPLEPDISAMEDRQ